MIKMAKKLYRWEQKRLQKRTEEAKQKGNVSAALFLESEMNALQDADCFFFYGGRRTPKALLTVFFPDETRGELTAAEFLETEEGLSLLYRKALRECKKIDVECLHTVRNPACGFSFDKIKGIRFSYDWSEYMLSAKMSVLAGTGEEDADKEQEQLTVRKKPAPEGDGTIRYSLEKGGQETASCRILPMESGIGCYLFGLKTKEEFRRTGMATRLLREIAKAYEGNEEAVMRLQVSSQNEPAERLYRKLGFLTEDEREYYKTEEC